MASLEVTESVRKAWRRYCKNHGRIMKDFTSETLKAVIRGEYLKVPKAEKGVNFKIVEAKEFNDNISIHT